MAATKKRQILVGSVSATGYIIRSAEIFISSPDGVEVPESNVEVEMIADLVWVNRSLDHWSCKGEVKVQVDIDKERFLIDGKPIEVINRKEIFNKVMRVLVGSYMRPHD